jgi:hypothetical protein
MEAWTTRGGGSQAFTADINAMVREDGGVEPLMSGLINMSNLMLNMVCLVQGRPREDILGSLVDEITDEPPPPIP